MKKNLTKMKKMSSLRKKIDQIDKKILLDLSARRKIVKNIAQLKAELNLPVLQKNRQQQIQKERPILGAKLGLEAKFVAHLFSLIQKESVREQKIIKKNIRSESKYRRGNK